MKVYIEYVIIDNFVIDYLLLKLTLSVTKVKWYKHGLTQGALLGTIFAVVFPLLNLPNVALFLIKILSGVLTLIVTAKFCGIKKLLKTFNVLLLSTFLFGGGFYAIFTLLNLEYSFLYQTANSVFPLGLMLVIAVLLYKTLYNFFCKLYQKKLIYPFIRQCKIVHKGQKLAVNGFIDSGNVLIYNNFYSVCIAGKRLVHDLLTQGFLNDGEIGEMYINTVNGKSKIKIFHFDFLEIYYGKTVNIIKGVKIGVLQSAINLSEDYDLILSADCEK